MRKLVAALGILAFVGSTAAQAQQRSWTGLYLGGNVGYAWGDVAVRDTNGGVLPGPFAYDTHGITGGVVIGYNQQLGPIVLGVEAEGGYMDLRGKGRIPSSNPAAHQDIDLDGGWYGILAGRAGIAIERTLIYGKAGWVSWDTSAGQKTTNPGFVTHRTGAFNGTVYGVGIEHAFVGNWTAKLEWLHYDFGREGGDQTSVSDDPIGYVYLNTHDVSADTVKLGLSYRF